MMLDIVMLALGAMCVPEAILPLSEALDDWQLDTRMTAVQSLGRTCLPEAAEPIIETFMVGALKVPPDPVMNAPLYPHLQAAPFLRRIVIVWRAAALTRLSYHRLLLTHGDPVNPL